MFSATSCMLYLNFSSHIADETCLSIICICWKTKVLHIKMTAHKKQVLSLHSTWWVNCIIRPLGRTWPFYWSEACQIILLHQGVYKDHAKYFNLMYKYGILMHCKAYAELLFSIFCCIFENSCYPFCGERAPGGTKNVWEDVPPGPPWLLWWTFHNYFSEILFRTDKRRKNFQDG